MKKIIVSIICFVLLATHVTGAFAHKANEVYAKHGMVSSAHELASKAGVEIMQKGGNAIDAAVGTVLALNVVEFMCSGIGGGGYMTIRFADTGETICLDYREQAPASATKDMFASEQSKKEKWTIHGGKSIGVPGLVMGLEYALERYGTMSFLEVAQPAIRLATEGFALDPYLAEVIVDNYDRLKKYNSPDDIAFIVDDFPVVAGGILKQPALAKAFKYIGILGARAAFYDGPLGAAICEAVNKNGGNMTMDDLRNYKMMIRTPVHGTYRGYQIYSMPPSSSGGTHIIQLLNIMENFDVKGLGSNNPDLIHKFCEATKLVFADRSKYMADPEFTELPLKGLQSKEYAKYLASKISNRVATDVKADNPWKYEGKESKNAYDAGLGGERMSTSSVSVVDQKGNIVTTTNTINYSKFMGATVIAPGFGFLLNDQMDDFSQNPESVNAPEPGKRPLSSMSPGFILDPEGRAFMSIGSAGGTRIITAIAQTIMNVIDHGMEMDAAIEACRFHNQKDKLIRCDLNRCDKSVLDALEKMGYELQLEEGAGILGTTQAILFDHAKGQMNGGADSRRLGVPVGF
ncbi:MAG: gamma-glutamyltransferase [Synergistaceae bacterium]|nr:gamma-glutamyltransferase [Synergistaceae bacterium]